MPNTGSAENSTLLVTAATPGEVNDALGANGQPLNPVGSILVKYDALNFDPGQHARVYRYVQLHSGATAAKGALVIWQDFFNAVVTTAGTITTLRNTVAGFLQSANCTAGNYTWILIQGSGVVLNEAGTSPVIGQQIVTGATTTGRCDLVAVATAAPTGPWGVFITAKNATPNGAAALGTDVCAAYINVPQPSDR